MRMRSLRQAWGNWDWEEKEKDATAIAKLNQLTDSVLSTASLTPVPVGEDLGIGGEKWAGGVLCKKDGCIYGIPRNAKHVLRFDPQTLSSSMVGADLGTVACKWSGGVQGKDECIYGIPSYSEYVLRFDPVTKSATLMGSDLGRGPKKWSGGARAKDGRIYCVPSNASQVLCIDTKEQTTTLVGDELTCATNKWNGAVLGKDGCIYGIPANASQMLCFDPKAQTSTLIGNKLGSASDKWSGGVLAPDGAIYGIPHLALQVLRFDPKSQVATRIGDDLGDGEKKWDGGVLGADGCIYGIPRNAPRILRIDPTTRTMGFVGDNNSEEFTGGYDGGALDRDGCIYCIPRNAARVLRFDPRNKAVNCVGDDLGVMSQKWLGGVMGPDENIYGIPNQAAQVLCFDSRTYSVSFIGDDLGEGGQKWQGGVLALDGLIYAVPRDAQQVLCINPETQSTTLVGRNLTPGGGKWNDGVLGPDGRMYCIPRNAQQVLRFDPTTQDWDLIGDEMSDLEQKWSGGVLGLDGCIYGVPSCATQVLRIDPKTSTCSLHDADFGDGANKWAGGCLAADGSIYCVPRNHNRMLKFVPATVSWSFVGEDLGTDKDKWCGAAVGKDGCIYGIPRSARRVLCFDPRSSAITLVGCELAADTNKWNGAILGGSGEIFSIPSSAPKVLRIFPHVSECAVLGCLRSLVGFDAKLGSSKSFDAKPSSSKNLNNSTVDGITKSKNAEHGAQPQQLLTHALPSKGHRHIIAAQWRMLSDVPMGPKALAAHLLFVPPCLGHILDMPSTQRSEFLSIPGVQEFMRLPKSIGPWLEDRIVNDPEMTEATARYFTMLSEIDDKDAFQELLLAIAALPKLLANMLKLPDEDLDRLIATDIVRQLVEFKSWQPLAVLAKLLDALSVLGLLSVFLALTWVPDTEESAYGEGVRRSLAIATLALDVILLLYEVLQLVAMCRLGLGKIQLFSKQTALDMLLIACVAAVAIKYLSMDEVMEEDIAVVIVVSTFLLFNKLLEFLTTVNQAIATFKTSLFLIIFALRPFIVVLLIVGFGFIHSFRVVQQCSPEPVEAFGQFGDASWEVFAMLTGAFDKGNYPRSTVLARALFVGYMIIVFIIMMNVLIAVISDSYASAQAKAETLYLRAQIQYTAVWDAMGLTRPRKLPHWFTKIMQCFREVETKTEAIKAQEESSEDLKQRILDLESRLKIAERSSWVKLEASLESMMAKMEVRLKQQLANPSP